MNKEIIKTQIEEKRAKLKAIIMRLEEPLTIGQKALAEAKIMQLKREIELLTLNLLEEEKALSKKEVLHLIDEALDNKNKEDFMRLTDMLKAMS